MSAQVELFSSATSTERPSCIVVGPFGIAEAWLLRVLQLDSYRVHAWHGDELGAPRDYRLTGRGYFYTASGIKRLIKLAGIEGVRVHTAVVAPNLRRRIK